MPGEIKMGARDKKDWETPWWVVRGLERLWGLRFTLDAAAYRWTSRAPSYLDQAANSLSLDTSWGQGSVVWLNPPYGAVEVPAFLDRALLAIERGEAHEVVCLIPHSTDTAVWGKIWERAAEIRFLIGRIAFEEEGKPSSGNTRGSAFLRFRRGHAGPPVVGPIERRDLEAAGWAWLNDCITGAA